MTSANTAKTSSTIIHVIRLYRLIFEYEGALILRDFFLVTVSVFAYETSWHLSGVKRRYKKVAARRDKITSTYVSIELFIL